MRSRLVAWVQRELGRESMTNPCVGSNKQNRERANVVALRIHRPGGTEIHTFNRYHKTVLR